MWILGLVQSCNELADKFCYLGEMLSVDGDMDVSSGTCLPGLSRTNGR